MNSKSGSKYVEMSQTYGIPQDEAWNFTKSNTPPWVFFHIF